MIKSDRIESASCSNFILIVCAQFDGNTRQANLIGIEYIIEALPGLVGQRYQRLNVMTSQLHSRRAEFISIAKPQMGVDVLKGKLSRPVTSIPGVVDKNSGITTLNEASDRRGNNHVYITLSRTGSGPAAYASRN